MIVVDTSVILAVLLNEQSKSALVQATMNAELAAPYSLHWEIGNALSAMLKRQRITLSEALQVQHEYQKIPIRFFDVGLQETLQIVKQHQIYAYDAYFIACAKQLSCSLITLDNGLQVAARNAQVSLIEVK